MYPYSHKQTTNTISNHTQITARETQKSELLALSQDKRFLSLLQIAMDETKQLAERYHKLMAQTEENSAASALLQSMYLDEKKHLRQLREAMFLITGSTPEYTTEEQPIYDTPSTSLAEYLEETFLTELGSADFHRNFLLIVPEGDIRDLFFEIFSDKQEHTNILTYLLCKYC